MDRHFAFYVDGNLLDIPRDESERNARYFLRLSFIFEQKKVDDQSFSRFMFYPAEEVVTFSRIFADKILLGLTYSELVEEKLYMMMNFEDSTFVVGDLPKFEEVKNVVETNFIFDAKPKEIKFEDEIKMIPIGASASFQNESGDPIEENIGAEIEKVIVEPLQANEEVLAIKLVTIEEEKIVACGNPACDIAAPVHVEIPVIAANLDDPLANIKEPEIIVIHPGENLVIAEPSEVKPVQEDLPENVPEPVRFVNANEDHGFLSLKYESNIEINGQVFPTALHYFAYEMVKQTGNEDLIKEFSGAMEIAKLSRLIEKKLARDAAGMPSPDEESTIMKIVNLRKFEQNPVIKEKLIEIQGEIIYANDNDTYWGRVWGIGPKGDNRLGKILMEVRKELTPEKEFGLPEENVQPEPVVEKEKEELVQQETKQEPPVQLKRFTIASCQSLIESPYNAEQIDEINKRVHYLNSSSMQDGKITNFSTEFLNRTFDTYDEMLMGGELRQTTSITLSWNEQPEPAILNDENGFELKLSKNVISGLFTKEGEKHQVNGVEVFDQLMVVQKFLESFIIAILTSKCPSVSDQQLSKALFNHTDIGKASFFPASTEHLVVEPVPHVEPVLEQESEKKKLSPEEIRTKLLEFLAKDIQPTVRLNNGTEQIIIGARSIEKALLKSGERIGYDEIQEIL